MSNDNYDPEFLAELDRESEFINSSGRKNFAKRFNLKETGESALIRLVPYMFDEKRKWFARVARHWLNGRPYVCTRDSAIGHGGREDGVCEICTTVDDLNKSRDKKVSDAAYRMSAVTQWLVYVMVYETFDSRGRSTYKARGDDILMPQEFWLYKEAFADVMTAFKNYMRRHENLPLSILDPEHGCDLLVTKAKRGMRFEREDSQPIGKDPQVMIDKVLKNINYKPDLPLEGNDLDDLLMKIEDICTGRGASSRGGRDDDRRGSRSRIDEDEDAPSRGDDRRAPARDDDRRSSRDDRAPVDDRRAPARDDDRRAPARDDRSASDDRRAPSRDERAPARSSTDDRRAPARDDDRRSSRDDRDDDRRAPARDDDRKAPPVDDDRRAPARDDDRRAPARDDRAPADDRRSSRDDRAPVDDRRSSRPSVDEDEDLPRGSRAVDDEAPPPLVRGADRRNPPPPPAAGRGRPPEEEDDQLPDGDKEKVPASEPVPGEIIPTSSATPAPVTSTPAEQKPREFQSTLGSALKARVVAHQNRPTTT